MSAKAKFLLKLDNCQIGGKDLLVFLPKINLFVNPEGICDDFLTAESLFMELRSLFGTVKVGVLRASHKIPDSKPRIC
jgi:hypothetical protein